MGTSVHELSPDPSYRRWGPACELSPDPSYRRWGPACMNLIQTLALGDVDQHS